MPYNDNAVSYGSQVVTIGATAYVAESITFHDASQIIERRDEIGQPNGQAIIAGFTDGSGTFQLASTTTVVPAVCATFTAARNDGTTIGAVITDVSEPQTQFDIRKVTLNFRKRVGA